MDVPDVSKPVWRKSRHSGINGCVEIAVLRGAVAVRDSKDPSGPVLCFRPDEWQAFIDGVRDGEFEV